MVGFVKNILKIDDTLDLFAVHVIGGLVGTILLVPLGIKFFGGLKLPQLSILEQLYVQIFSSRTEILYSGILTLIILIVLKKTVGIRVSSNEEEMGLDQSSHSESDYNLYINEYFKNKYLTL